MSSIFQNIKILLQKLYDKEYIDLKKMETENSMIYKFMKEKNIDSTDIGCFYRVYYQLSSQIKNLFSIHEGHQQQDTLFLQLNIQIKKEAFPIKESNNKIKDQSQKQNDSNYKTIYIYLSKLGKAFEMMREFLFQCYKSKILTEEIYYQLKKQLIQTTENDSQSKFDDSVLSHFFYQFIYCCKSIKGKFKYLKFINQNKQINLLLPLPQQINKIQQSVQDQMNTYANKQISSGKTTIQSNYSSDQNYKNLPEEYKKNLCEETNSYNQYDNKIHPSSKNQQYSQYQQPSQLQTTLQYYPTSQQQSTNNYQLEKNSIPNISQQNYNFINLQNAQIKGFQNISGSCYVNSILQVLQQIYYLTNKSDYNIFNQNEFGGQFKHLFENNYEIEFCLKKIIKSQLQFQNESEFGGDAYICLLSFLNQIKDCCMQQRLKIFTKTFEFSQEKGTYCNICESIVEDQDNSFYQINEIFIEIKEINEIISLFKTNIQYTNGLCKKCKRRQPLTIRQTYMDLPDFLFVKVLQNQSYQYYGHNFSKDENIFNELFYYNKSLSYRIIGVCNYFGYHYTYSALYNEKWYELNDKIISQKSPSTSHAFFFVLQKQL